MAQGLGVFVLKEVADRRLSICRGCEKFFAPTTTCTECGCFMIAKVRMSLGNCPLDKWAEANANETTDIDPVPL